MLMLRRQVVTDLLARANQLEKTAKTIRDGAGDQQAIERTKTAVDKLRAAVIELGARLKTRRALDEVVPAHDGMSDPELRAPLSDLSAFVAARGRPTPQKIQAATDKVKHHAAVLDQDARTRWQSWTASSIQGIPRHKAAALSQPDRLRIEGLIRNLEIAARKEPNSSVVEEFRYYLRSVHEDLEKVELSGAILAVLERFATPDGIPLSDLTDDEIATLRSDPAIAVQFVVRRQV